MVPPVVLIPAPASQLTDWYAIERGTRRLRVDKTLGETLTTEWNVNIRQSIVQKSPLRNAVMVEIWLEKIDSLSSIYNFRRRKTLCRRGGGRRHLILGSPEGMSEHRFYDRIGFTTLDEEAQESESLDHLSDLRYSGGAIRQ
jgi:hypothetical protein